MILQIFIGLLFLSGVSLLITQGKRKRIWSILLLCCLGTISYFFVVNLNMNTQNGFIYQWLPYNMIKADFNISASQNIQYMLKPLILLLSGLVYLNTIYKSEQHSLHFNTLLILNFVALILLLSSHDFLQLMFASCMFSVIGFYMPDQVLPKKDIFIFNFLSETAIFMALAIVYGNTHSISLADLQQFVNKGSHKDIVATLLLFAIACKSGLLFVNGHYFNLGQISFNRIIAIMLMSTPVSSFVILIKLLPILNATSLVPTVLPVWICLSVITFILIALLNNNIKSKLISLSLAVMSASLHFIYKDATLLYKLVPYIFSILFLISILFVVIYNSSSKETDISYLGDFWRITKINFIVCLLLLISSVAVFSRINLNNYEKIFVVLFVMVVSLVFKRVFFSKPCDNKIIISGAKNINMLYILPILCVCGWFLWQTKFWQYQSFYFLSICSAISIIFIPISKIDNIGKHSIWHNNFLSQFYNVLFIRPLKLFGRILWLAFDVVVIERSVITSVSNFSKAVVVGMHKIQENSSCNYLYGILLGFIIIGIYFIKDIFK